MIHTKENTEAAIVEEGKNQKLWLLLVFSSTATDLL
jgi:hypothetical protein